MAEYSILDSSEIDAGLELIEDESAAEPITESETENVVHPESVFLRAVRSDFDVASAKRKIYLERRIEYFFSADIFSKPNLAKQSLDFMTRSIQYYARQCYTGRAIIMRISEKSNFPLIIELYRMDRMITNDPILINNPYFMKRYREYVWNTYVQFLQFLSDETGIPIRDKSAPCKNYDAGMVLENKEDRGSEYDVIRVWWKKTN